VTEGPTLEDLALRVGDRVRFRRGAQRWHEATVAARARDGSVSLHDAKGASRAITAERLEVRVPGRRGALTWEPVLEWAGRRAQRTLFEQGPGTGSLRP